MSSVSDQTMQYITSMKEAETKLTEFSHRFATHIKDYDRNDVEVEIFDCALPESSISSLKSSTTCQVSGSHELLIHGIRVHYKKKIPSVAPPLVLLHGYANGALYYYRNIIGLSYYFSSVYSLDMMGWGLSSRPKFHLTDTSVEAAESFFVDSLEEWRKKNGIDKMILGGHSMGGYIAVAYCEKYPQHVERLILLSPVGVPHKEKEEEARIKRGMGNVSLKWKAVRYTFGKLWEWDFTPLVVSRVLSEERGRNLVSSYVQRRLPAITSLEEQINLSEYLYLNSILPASGENSLNRILLPGAFARNPLMDRIPKLTVSNPITIVYGEKDWMDKTGGLEVKRICVEQKKVESLKNKTENGKSCELIPDINVHIIKDAGHLLMLENWEEFNSSVIIAGMGVDSISPNMPHPTVLK